MSKVRQKDAVERREETILYKQGVPRKAFLSFSLFEFVCPLGDSHMLFTHLALYFPRIEWTLSPSQE